jgi:nucleotidyltransferase/DNA polymerase involved in DNA repair
MMTPVRLAFGSPCRKMALHVNSYLPERQVPVARALAQKVKRALRDQVGECLTCSIGIAPNVFLGKVGSDLQKPDGLVVITMDNLPDVLLGLELQDIYGIGVRMEQRLHRAGILTVAQLWNAPPFQLRRIWGGINGLLFHQMLHGVDIQPPTSRFSKSIGHQHVLEPGAIVGGVGGRVSAYLRPSLLLGLFEPFFPLVFALDLSRLE